MSKVIALVDFRGVNYADLFTKGNTYDFEQKRAETLSARGLVKILTDAPKEAEAPKVEEAPKVAEQSIETKKEETDNAVENEPKHEETTEAQAEDETPKRGRPRKTE